MLKNYSENKLPGIEQTGFMKIQKYLLRNDDQLS